MTVVTKYAQTFSDPYTRWTNFTTAQLSTSDNLYATRSNIATNTWGSPAFISNFGFAIPATAVITSMKLEWECKQSYTGESINLPWKLGLMGVWELTAGVNGVTQTVDTIFSNTFTGANLPTVAQINDVTFGLRIDMYKTVGYTSTFSLDYVTLTITYYIVPTVTTTAVTAIGETSVATGGNCTDIGDSAVSAKGVCWNTTGSPTIADSKTTDGSGVGAFTSTPNTLIVSRHYHLRAYATNASVTGYGAEIAFDTASYFKGSLGRGTIWSHALTLDEALTDSVATTQYAGHSLAKGTVVLKDYVKNRYGAMVPAAHIRAGSWIQNLETGQGKPLYITGHSVDLAGNKNALTIGKDWMEKEIGVRMAELLAIPPTSIVEPVAEEPPEIPDTPEPEGRQDEVTPGDQTDAPEEPRYDPYRWDPRFYW